MCFLTDAIDLSLRTTRTPMWNPMRRQNGRLMVPEEPPICEEFAESLFTRMLCLERKRAERTGRRFVLMLVECQIPGDSRRHVAHEILATLSRTTRETDLKGWYKDGSTVGLIFTEIGPSDGRLIARALLTRVNDALRDRLTIEDIGRISISFHVFPDDWEKNDGSDEKLYPDLIGRGSPEGLSRTLKRALDISGGAMALAVLLPVFLLIAIAVKLTSRGPVLFRQKRLGRYGRPFTFLKFRSMYRASASTIHQQYMKQFIAGTADPEAAAGSGTKIFKLSADPRITPLGRFLRRTSLDELPQLINVLRGDMSLVGPRPPIPYEFQHYGAWHKRRLLTVQPGITGLWQVTGRSKTTFDEMVRMDIKYAMSWSLWLDIKILLQTPRAVLSGEGAC